VAASRSLDYAGARVHRASSRRPAGTLEAFELNHGRFTVIGPWADDAQARIAPFDAIEFDLAVLWADVEMARGECGRNSGAGRRDPGRSGAVDATDHRF
jgi:hypothetical protein